MAKQMKVVMVEWLDAVSRDGWACNEEELEPVRMYSAGILIHDRPTHVKIAANFDGENETDSCTMSIPRGMIVSVKTLTRLKVRK